MAGFGGGLTLQQIMANAQTEMLKSTVSQQAQPTVTAPPVTATPTKETTTQTSAYTAPVSLYSNEQLKQSADQAIGASQQYAQSASNLQPSVKRAADEITKNAQEFKASVDSSTEGTLNRLSSEMQAQLAANQLNSATLTQYNSVLNSDDLRKAEELANTDLLQASAKLSEAQISSRSGGIFDAIVGTFKAEIYSEQVARAQNTMQGINATKAQATAEMLQELEVNARLANAPFADEIARAQFTEESSMAIASKAMNNIKITGEEFNALGQTLNIDKEVLSAYKSKLDVMMQAGNASSSMYSSLLQQMSYESAKLDLERSQKAFGDEQAFYAYHTAGFESYAEARGIQTEEGFKNLLTQMKATGQMPPVLAEYFMHTTYKENSGGSAVSRYITNLESNKEQDYLSQQSYKFVQDNMPRERERITMEQRNAILATKKTGEQLTVQEEQKVAESVETEMKRLQVVNEDGSVNYKAIGLWDRKYADFLSKMNGDTSEALQSGLVNMSDLKVKLKSPQFKTAVAKYVPADVIKFIEEQADSTMITDLVAGKPAGEQLKSNLAVMIESIPFEKFQDNAYTMQYINNASKALAATYKVNRSMANDVLPNWSDTKLRLNDLGNLSTISIENPADLQQMMLQLVAKRRKSISGISDYGRRGPAPTQN